MTAIMTRRNAAAFAMSIVAWPVVSLAEAPKSGPADALSVEITGIALPVVQGNRLVNYLFGVIKIEVSDGASTFFLRENTYLLRDAIIRIAARAPIPVVTSINSYDRVAVTRVVLRAVQAIRPSARVIRVTVLDAAFMRN